MDSFCGRFGKGLIGRPNQALQRTPLAASEIVAILSARFGYNIIAVYRGGAAERQSVRRPGRVVSIPFPYDTANWACGTPVVPAPSCRCSLCRVWYDGWLCGLPVVPGVIRRPVVPKARYGRGDSRCAWFR